MTLMVQLGRVRAHGEIWVARHTAWGLLALVLALVACLVMGASAVQRREQLTAKSQELIRLQQHASERALAIATASPPVKLPAHALLETLPVEGGEAAQVEELIALASRMGLRVRRATYSSDMHDSATVVRSLQIDLPLGGNYVSIRRWVDEVLGTQPNVSIESSEVGRESVADANLNARVRLSIWYRLDSLSLGDGLGPSLSRRGDQP